MEVISNVPFSFGQVMAYLLFEKNENDLSELNLNKEELTYLRKFHEMYKENNTKINRDSFENHFFKLFIEKNDRNYCANFARTLNSNFNLFEKFIEVLSDFDRKSTEIMKETR